MISSTRSCSEGRCWELSQCFQAHPNQIVEWKKQLLEHEPEIFSKYRRPGKVPSEKDFHTKIGQLSIENDFYQARSVASAIRA